ncbi:MAG: beta-ketoacyl-[acyl-carrier-protein] synthase family protein [Nitrospirae bacterium]|nr:beta-ketoacyl-[acyl-carrier-protein] synthase family protein [Nitrospirota bacterium]MBF0592538.1 beta-ketoacyl-[acyl-carrier-protein] synthase family protein [Nitrospirota bacterium]
MRRVAVTGMGIISPMGNTSYNFFENLISGVPAVKRITGTFAPLLNVKIAAEADFDPTEHFPIKQIRTLDRTTQMALVAAKQAWSDSGIVIGDDEQKRAGVYMGTGLGGAQTIDSMLCSVYKDNVSRVNPLSVVKIMCNAPASHISLQYALRGPCLTFSIACASSAVAIGEAFRLIKFGQADVVVAGGTESMLTLSSMKSWESLGVLAREDDQNPAASCKPFSMDRSGFVLGEGAAVIILEEMERARARGARIYAELTGYGTTSDAHHITAPTVEGQSSAMRLALEEARMNPQDIDYINAHGTATEMNDLVETQAIKIVFGADCRIPVSSTKSMHGHLIGAAGALELIAAILSMQHKSIPPTANLKTPDPQCDLDYVPNQGRVGLNVRVVMSNSFAFGGSNAVLIARLV